MPRSYWRKPIKRITERVLHVKDRFSLPKDYNLIRYPIQKLHNRGDKYRSNISDALHITANEHGSLREGFFFFFSFFFFWE